LTKIFDYGHANLQTLLAELSCEG